MAIITEVITGRASTVKIGMANRSLEIIDPIPVRAIRVAHRQEGPRQAAYLRQARAQVPVPRRFRPRPHRDSEIRIAASA